MPKTTFYNLTEEKKKLIIDITINEFYQYGYEKASISRIVEKAAIAKGSFYQYFENKEDLFGLIIDTARQKKLYYLNDITNRATKMKFFELLEHLCIGSLYFLRENTQLASITDRFIKNASQSLKEKIIGENAKHSNEFMRQLLQSAISRKEVKDSIDVDYVANYITNLFIYMSDYIRMQNEDISNIQESEYKSIVSKTIDLIATGIGI